MYDTIFFEELFWFGCKMKKFNLYNAFEEIKTPKVNKANESNPFGKSPKNKDDSKKFADDLQAESKILMIDSALNIINSCNMDRFITDKDLRVFLEKDYSQIVFVTTTKELKSTFDMAQSSHKFDAAFKIIYDDEFLGESTYEDVTSIIKEKIIKSKMKIGDLK